MFAHNKERGKRDLPPFQQSLVLTERAQKWAEEMARRNSPTHSRLKMEGTEFWIMGENIAMGYSDIDSVMNGWMNSSSHRRNILNPKYTHAGFGYARTSNGTPYWCAQFGGK
jgi:uncharacterized protein YkwD